jgi:hypothetical protein
MRFDAHRVDACPPRGEACYYMWPPFTLTGIASPPLNAPKAVGPWTVAVLN